MATSENSNHGYKTAQEMVLNYLRQAIPSGVLRPGQRIQQDELATKLGVSRMPVREALRQLEAEGLVTFYPHHGVVVNDVSVEDVEDIYEIRIALESAAARLGTQNITPEDIQYLSKTLVNMEGLSDSFSPSDWLALNGIFHGTIYKASNRPRLQKLISSTNLTITPYIRAYIMMPNYLGRSNEEHRRIFQAVESRDGAKAEELTKTHLRETADAVISYLKRLTA